VGLLEDDDYSARAREARYQLRCAEDVLVHHFGEASFGKLFADGEYSRLLEANRKLFEEKWQRSWEPYGRRPDESYERLLERLPVVVGRSLPLGATILVASKGDEQLLALHGYRTAHFPQSPEGTYAGHHPASSNEAVLHLEDLRKRGASFLLFPRTAFWWLEHYDGLREHLESQCQMVATDQACVIFALTQAPGRQASTV
jgi:hypothetical protein